LSTNCGGVCTNLQSNHWNCGSCGVVCGEREQCRFGKCVFDPGPMTCDPEQCRPPSYCWNGRCVILEIPDDLIPVWVLE
jgi:hypothetical protein